MSGAVTQEKKRKGGGKGKAVEYIVPEGVDLSEFEEQSYTQEQLDGIMQSYGKTLDGLEEGKLINGTVIKITDEDVFVDINFKSEGVIPINEFKDPETLEVGQEIEVFLEEIESQNGQVLLSKVRADFMRIWNWIREVEANNEVVEGRVLRRIKGGLVMDLRGVDAFLPGSQIDLRQIPDMDSLIGKSLRFRIIKINKSRRNIVVSRRVVLEEERKQMRESSSGSWPRDRSWKASSKTSRISALSSILADWTVCCISRICRGAESTIPPKLLLSAKRSKSRCWISMKPGIAFRWE